MGETCGSSIVQGARSARHIRYVMIAWYHVILRLGCTGRIRERKLRWIDVVKVCKDISIKTTGVRWAYDM